MYQISLNFHKTCAHAGDGSVEYIRSSQLLSSAFHNIFQCAGRRAKAGQEELYPAQEDLAE